MGWLIFFAAMAILLIIVAVEEHKSDAISAAVSEHKLVNSDEWLTEDIKAALSYRDDTFEEIF